jgi:F0F1-type ATP synthase assembly protein I
MRSLVGTSAGVIVNIANYLILPIIHLFRMQTTKKSKQRLYLFGESLKVGVSITL